MDEEFEDGRGNSVRETCYFCGQECSNEEEMMLHMTCHREQLVCLFCNFETRDSDEMTGHINEMHPNDVSDVEKVQDKITCLFCDFATASSDEMNVHINIIHLSESPCNAKGNPVIRPNKDNRRIQAKDKIPATSYTQTVLRVNSGFLEVERDHKKLKLDSRIKFEPSNTLPCHKLVSAESSINGSHFGIHSEENKPYLRNDVDSICSRVDTNTNSKPVVSSSRCYSDFDDYSSTHVHRSNGDSVLNKTIADLDARLNLQAECYLCPFCEFVTDDEQAYERHLREEQSAGEAPMVCDELRPLEGSGDSASLRCPVCKVNFLEQEPYDHHILQHGLQRSRGAGTKRLIIKQQRSASEAPVFNENAYRVLESESGESFRCPICGLSFMVHDTCVSHLDRHLGREPSSDGRKPRDNFGNGRPFRSDSAKQSSIHETSSGSGAPEKPSVGSFLTQNSAWPTSALMDDAGSSTSGVHEQMVRHYQYSRAISNVWLCSYIEHYASKFDRGWGCGFRNFQMLLSCLMRSPIYSSRLLEGPVGMPSVLGIQLMIETAWNKGFDRDGSKHFNGTLVNTKKWIGSTDLAALLSSCGIKCTIVDFHAPSGPNSTHPLLFEWAKSYFEKPASFKPPLYFQYNGHSKTIVGVEEHHDQSLRLLILDPSVPPYKMKSVARAEASEKLIRLIRHSVSALKHKQYQLLAVDGILDEDEIEESKSIKSIRVP